MSKFVAVKPNVSEYLNNYTGDWRFIVDVRRKFFKYGTLSLAQQEAIERAIEREKSYVEPKKEFTFKPGDFIGISKQFAQKLTEKTHLNPFFCNLTVTKVHNETWKAVEVSVLFNSEVAFTCNMCRRPLSCEISQACGIGPVCYKRFKGKRPSLERAQEMLKEIEAYSKEVGEVGPIWIPKYYIKQQESNELANELFG